MSPAGRQQRYSRSQRAVIEYERWKIEEKRKKIKKAKVPACPHKDNIYEYIASSLIAASKLITKFTLFNALFFGVLINLLKEKRH